MFSFSVMIKRYHKTFLCLFVCLEFFVILEHFFTHLETSPLPMKGCKLCSELMAIEQWGFFRVPHLLWHGSSVYNGHLRWPVTLTPIAEQWSCHYLFKRLRSVAVRIRTHYVFPMFMSARRIVNFINEKHVPLPTCSFVYASSAVHIENCTDLSSVVGPACFL